LVKRRKNTISKVDCPHVIEKAVKLHQVMYVLLAETNMKQMPNKIARKIKYTTYQGLA